MGHPRSLSHYLRIRGGLSLNMEEEIKVNEKAILYAVFLKITKNLGVLNLTFPLICYLYVEVS